MGLRGRERALGWPGDSGAGSCGDTGSRTAPKSSSGPKGLGSVERERLPGRNSPQQSSCSSSPLPASPGSPWINPAAPNPWKTQPEPPRPGVPPSTQGRTEPSGAIPMEFLRKTLIHGSAGQSQPHLPAGARSIPEVRLQELLLLLQNGPKPATNGIKMGPKSGAGVISGLNPGWDSQRRPPRAAGHPTKSQCSAALPLGSGKGDPNPRNQSSGSPAEPRGLEFPAPPLILLPRDGKKII